MNKRISDLLDAYEDDRVELADAAPLSSARIKELTMRQITERKPKTLRRAPFRLLAAAAAAAALIFSAVASNAFGAGDLMKGLFYEEATPEQVDILNRTGVIFEGAEGVTSNGATITPIAALADEDCLYLQLRVEAPEGVVLPDEAHYRCHYYLDLDDPRTWPKLETPWAELAQAYPHMLSHWEGPDGELIELHGYCHILSNIQCDTLPDDDPTDNVKDFVICFYTNEYSEGVKLNDGLPKRVTIHGLSMEEYPLEPEWVDQEDKTYTEFFSGTFVLDFDGKFSNSSVSIDCAGAEWNDPETGETNRLDAMRLSPLGVKFEFRTNLVEFRDGKQWLEPAVPGDTRIVMKDGSEILIEHYQRRCHPEEGYLEEDDPFFQIIPELLTETPKREVSEYWRFYGSPLDLTQVDYVQFGDNIYPVNVG